MTMQTSTETFTTGDNYTVLKLVLFSNVYRQDSFFANAQFYLTVCKP